MLRARPLPKPVRLVYSPARSLFMHKLCIPAFSLVLAVPGLARAADPPGASASAPPGASASASATVTASVKVSDQDALNDDILAVIDLPIAAADAREAGVEETELKAALDSTREAGLPASEATEVVSVEAEETRTRGAAKKGFGQWVRLQLAAGLRGKKLADKIKARKDEVKELDAKAQDDLRAKVAKQAELNKAWRVKWLEKRKELVAAGKKPVIGFKDRHDKLAAKIDRREDKIDAKQDEAAVKLREVEVKLSTATDAEKPALEAEKKRLEKQLERLDKREDKLGKLEDKLTSGDHKGIKPPMPRPPIPDGKAEGKADIKGDLKAGHHGHPGKADKKGADKKAGDGSAAQ